MKKLIILFTFLIAVPVFAAPQYRVERTILPETTSTYEIGTSTRSWLRGFFDTITFGSFTSTSTTATSTIAGNLKIDGNLEVSGVSLLNLVSSGNFVSTGSVTATHFIANSASATSTFAGGITGPGNFIVQSSSGRVGIGTTGPLEKLVVSDGTDSISMGPLGVGGFVGLARGNVDVGTTNYFLAQDGTQTLLNSNAGSVNFRIGNADKMVVASTGNVGIGTTSPAYLLDVDGSFRVGTTTNANQLVVNGDSGYVGIGTENPQQDFHIAGSGSNAGIRLEYDASNLGNIIVDTNYVNFSSTGLLGVRSSMTYGFESSNFTSAASNLTIQTLNSSDRDIIFSPNGTEAMRIDATNGNVGIGETAPGSKLSVSGGASIGASYDTTAAPSNGLIIEGNVGIGTTSPSYKLDVMGGIASYGSSFFGGAITATSTLNVSGLTTLGYASTTQISSTGSAYFATASGNVGIGTTGPTLAKLRVSGNNTFVGKFGGLGVFGGEDAVNYGANAVVFGYNINYLNALGGTGSSAKTFLTNAAYLSAANTDTFNRSNTQSASLAILMDGFSATKAIDFNYAAAGAADSAIAWTNRVRFDMGTGNVGIGTTTPWAKLSILGNSATAPVFALATSTTKTVFSIDADGIEDVKYGIHCQIGQFETIAAQSIPTGSTYTKITSLASTTPATNTRYCTANTTNSKIVVTRAGIYEVTGSVNFSGSVNSTFKGAVFIGGVEQNLIHFARKLSANDVGSVSFTGQFVATSSSNVDLRVRHDSGGAVDFSPMYINLNVKYLGK